MSKSRFTKTDAQPHFKKHNVYEVPTSLTEAKQIADDHSEAHRYAYRATALVVGSSAIRPYDPVYIDGVPNGLSGYWTVLGIRHKFGGPDAPYMMELELGTDTIGDTDSNAIKNSEKRNVGNELAGKDLSAPSSVLRNNVHKINGTKVVTPKVVKSPKISKPASLIISSETSPYHHASTIPDFSIAPRTTTWITQKGNKKV